MRESGAASWSIPFLAAGPGSSTLIRSETVQGLLSGTAATRHVPLQLSERRNQLTRGTPNYDEDSHSRSR